jgi:hypothetical protein
VLRAGRSRAVALAAGVVLSLSSAACSIGASKADLKSELGTKLTQAGIPADLARCVADRFIGAMTPSQIKSFLAEQHLTSAERQQIDDLTTLCLTTSTTTGG